MPITKVSEYLWRGPRPTSMDELKALGVQQIINLEVGWFEWFHGLWEQEQHQANIYLIQYEHLPISDWMFPTRKEFDAIMLKIAIAMRTPTKTFIHCLHGKSRTGLVCAAYRVKEQGWPIDKAIQEMMDMQFEVFPYQYLGWVHELKEYLK